MPASGLYIGLMSGTSVDGVDAALVEIYGDKCSFIAHHSLRYSDKLRQSLLQLNTLPTISLEQLISLDHQVAVCFADTSLALLSQQRVPANEITAIGSHGQTIYHLPYGDITGTLQIGDPNVIASKTGIDVVADFRRADMARGGQGAPLTPAFHLNAMGADEPRVILNLGGIANISILDTDVTGFDTGPANTLMDAWCQLHHQQPFDKDGQWAREGTVDQALLDDLLADPFFAMPAPKSTGADYFNLAWLESKRDISATEDKNIQATLLELTVQSIADSIEKYAVPAATVYLCGGGAHNAYLVQRLKDRLATRSVAFTADLGVDGDWCESIAFAWLAYRHINREYGSIPRVTGARQPAILGGLYPHT